MAFVFEAIGECAGGLVGGVGNGFNEAFKSKAQKLSDKHQADLQNIKSSHGKWVADTSNLYEKEITEKKLQHDKDMNTKILSHKKDMWDIDTKNEKLTKETQSIINQKIQQLKGEYEPAIAKIDQEVQKKKKEGDELEEEVRILEFKIRKQKALNEMKEMNVPQTNN